MFRKCEPTLKMTLQQAAEGQPDFLPIVQSLRETTDRPGVLGGAVAGVVKARYLPKMSAGEPTVVLICLPERVRDSLPALLEDDADIVNLTSFDLTTSTTCLVLKGGGKSLELATYPMDESLRKRSGAIVLVVAVVCGEDVWVRRLHAEDPDLLLARDQASGIGAGYNFEPYRWWSEEELQRAVVEAPAAQKAWEEEGSAYRPKFWVHAPLDAATAGT